MRRAILSLNEQMEEIYVHSLSCEQDGNKINRNKMKKMISNAMNKQLTDRQRQCLSMYYFDNKKIEQISSELGLHKSTISRHITAAKTKLQKLKMFVE